MVSVNESGEEGDDNSYMPSLSADGRYVAFESSAKNLVNEDKNRARDVFVRDTKTGRTIRASVGLNGGDADGASSAPSISGDGKYIAFSSYASNIVPGTSGTSTEALYLRDLTASTSILITYSDDGKQGGGNPSISSDGTRIAFWSFSSKLVKGDSNGVWDVFLYDSKASPNIKLVSVSSEGAQRNQGDESSSRMIALSISPDGRYIAYATTAGNLVEGDTNGKQDIFIYDTKDSTTVRASLGPDNTELNDDSPVGHGERIAISNNGWIAFSTKTGNYISNPLSSGSSNVVMRNILTGEIIPLTNSGYGSGHKGPAAAK